MVVPRRSDCRMQFCRGTVLPGLQFERCCIGYYHYTEIALTSFVIHGTYSPMKVHGRLWYVRIASTARRLIR